MAMIMLIDALGERYGMLPSEVIARANTFDLFILDTALGYRNVLQERANKGEKAPPPKLSVDKMQAMLDRVRNSDASK